MHLSKRLLIISCAALFLAIQIGHGKHSAQSVQEAPNNVGLHAETVVAKDAQVDNRQGSTRSVIVLLLRLQEIQTQLNIRPEPRAETLSNALFELSLMIREEFDADLLVAYEDLSAVHQKAFLQIAALVKDLDDLLDAAKPIEILPQVTAI